MNTNVKENTLYDYTISFKWLHGQSWIKAKWQADEESAIEYLRQHMSPQPVWSIEVTDKKESLKV